MESKFSDKRLRFLLGDIRDFDRLNRAFEDIDIVFHAAALKHVPVIEYNPFEAIKTNVIGSQNVISACLQQNVERVICIGTDKAVFPINTYGATKLLMEKLFVTASNYLNKKRYHTKFITLRYGNVIGSSSSVIPKFIEQIKNKKSVTITDPKMTRFSITMDEALDFILNATKIGQGSEIFVPKMKAYTITSVKDALFELLENTGEKITGIREGEKLDEVLISDVEMRFCWELDDMYVIHSSINKNYYEGAGNLKKIESMDSYSSVGASKLSNNELKKIIENYCL
jgi:UDP-N-acetylglucosamine 4,6-dehydratase/UDP-glucose 4-epimerase